MYILIIILCLIFFLLRFVYLIKCVRTTPINDHKRKPPPRKFIGDKNCESIRTMIILGSGGHTAEMLNIIKYINIKNYTPRYYIIANTDSISESKVQNLEHQLRVIHPLPGLPSGNGTTTTLSAPPRSSSMDYTIIKINRSRYVGQSYFTSIFSTLYSILNCIPIVYANQPELILCNGPGTCIPICLIVFLFRLIWLNTKCRIIFIESFCRIETLSLSGKILLWFSDEFIVQWPKLQAISNRIKYFGRLS